MTKISPRLLEETITTAGYRHTTNGQNLYYVTAQDGRLVASGTLTNTGRLDIAIPALRRIARNLTELGAALDELAPTTSQKAERNR